MSESPDLFQDRLNDFLDSELDPRERRALEAHLEGCEDCRRALQTLRDIVRAARELPDVEPPPAVWSAVAEKIAARSTRAGHPDASFASKSWRRNLFSALAVAATLALALALWVVLRPGQPPPLPPDSQALTQQVTDELRAAEMHYEKAIGGLEQIIAQNGGVLPPEVASVLNQNLDLIEGAIAESRTAMSSEPDSTVAQESLLDALRKKVALLQSTILLINEIRKGQGENALDLIEEMRKTTTHPNPI